MIGYLFVLLVGLFDQAMHLIPLQESDRTVVLADVRLFPCQSEAEVRRLLRLCDWEYETRKTHILTTRGLEARCWFDRDYDWRKMVWASYADVLNVERPYYSRLKSLCFLKGYIGEEAFYAGQLPPIISNLK